MEATTQFTRYLQGVFREPRAFYSEWPLERILRDHTQWSHTTDSTWFYIIYNDNFRQRTHMGCTHDLKTRFAQHQESMRCHAATRHAGGSWKVIVCVQVPPIRNWRIRDLRLEAQGKGIAARTHRLLAHAHSKQLDWRVAAEVLDPAHDLYMPDVVSLLHSLGSLNVNVLSKQLMSVSVPPRSFVALPDYEREARAIVEQHLPL